MYEDRERNSLADCTVICYGLALIVLPNNPANVIKNVPYLE